jgi:hypothetical protein
LFFIPIFFFNNQNLKFGDFVGITNILILDLLTYAEKLLDVFGWMEGKEREKKHENRETNLD